MINLYVINNKNKEYINNVIYSGLIINQINDNIKNRKINFCNRITSKRQVMTFTTFLNNIDCDKYTDIYYRNIRFINITNYNQHAYIDRFFDLFQHLMFDIKIYNNNINMYIYSLNKIRKNDRFINDVKKTYDYKLIVI